MKINNLTLKQEDFCQAYIRLGDKSAAYREAYSCSKMKPETVHVKANELSNVGKVSVRIKELQAEVAIIAKEKFEITSEEMLRHLNILRKARIDEYVEYYEFDFPITKTTGTGKNKITSTTIEKRTELRLKTFDKLSDDQKMCIEGIKQTKYGIEIKLHGKDWTIEKINKHIGFYEKDNEQKNPATDISSPEERDARIAALVAKLNKNNNQHSNKIC